MPTQPIKLGLDPTGTNIDNRIVNEEHVLSGNAVRSIAPNYGVFFANQFLEIRDKATPSAPPLTRGVHYQVVELHIDATEKYEGELCEILLIIDPSVSGRVLVTYQALGGHYCDSNAACANMYQTLLKTPSMVKWSNVINRPASYPPSLHRHLLDDVFGFEAVVDALERIHRSLSLSQVAVLTQMLDEVLADHPCKEAALAIPSRRLMKKFDILYLLSSKKLLGGPGNSVHIEPDRCSYCHGYTITATIDSSGYPAGRTLYWEAVKPEGEVLSLMEKSGTFVSNNGQQTVHIYIRNGYPDEEEIFLCVKDAPTAIEYIGQSHPIKINGVVEMSDHPLYFHGTSHEADVETQLMLKSLEPSSAYATWKILLTSYR